MKHLFAGCLVAVALHVGAMAAPAGRQDTVFPKGGVPVAAKQFGRCSAYAPAGWTGQSNPQSSTAELVSGDRRAYAGWGVRGVNTAMEPFYGPLFGAPETAAAAMASEVLKTYLNDGGQVRYTSPPQPFLGYFTLRRFATARSHGLVFYRAYPGMSAQEYVGSTYFAVADKSLGSGGLATASGVAVSIRCKTEFVPVRDTGGAGGKGGKASTCGGEGSLRRYNKELGHQQAHSPSTGENYLLDHATQWQENGPQGAGYYRQNGNFQEKLELGRSDDC